ncbi:MAG: hypothetical protein HPY57_15435 [Ignavibacteria bacterium]|nr:hypothetical protein [Ignavibacteria bacterium]
MGLGVGEPNPMYIGEIRSFYTVSGGTTGGIVFHDDGTYYWIAADVLDILVVVLQIGICLL